MAENKKPKGVWRTVMGRKVFIADGQTLKEAMKASGKFTGNAGADEDEDKRLARVQSEYRASTNKRLAGYVNDVLAGNETQPFKLVEISKKESDEIKELTGVDVSGFSRILVPDSIRHISKRHGEKGQADQSMADIADIARMEYVLSNYDSVKAGSKTTKSFKNADNTNAKTVVYEKRINGNYYVAEAVPDTEKKQLVIMSAYKKNPKAVNSDN